MEKIIKDFAIVLEAIEKELTSYFKDKNIPLDERWENFCLAIYEGVFNNPKGYVWHNEIIEKELGLCWYDDFYMERYSEKDFPDFMEILEDGLSEDDCVYCASERLQGKITKEHIDAIKEDMLQSGYSGFVFDW